MPKLSPAEIEELLTERGHLARIATLKPDSAPSVVPVWFLYENGKIHITPRKHSEFGRNLRRDPRVAITIDEESGVYRKVLVEGRVEFLYEDGEDARWRDLYRRISCRYIDEASADHYISETIDQPRSLIAVDLAQAKVTTWRMPREGEPYTGIWAKRYYVEGSKMGKIAAAGGGPDRGDKLRVG
ncbi:MAG: pyridoxamine 5'-phosphate oxidase family protein [Deltaproteobacteria bacterium]|nr:pyridoxamine 5'-phosphate oxidase family protein [Deltaproteobacteria bacterium]